MLEVLSRSSVVLSLATCLWFSTVLGACLATVTLVLFGLLVKSLDFFFEWLMLSTAYQYRVFLELRKVSLVLPNIADLNIRNFKDGYFVGN